MYFHILYFEPHSLFKVTHLIQINICMENEKLCNSKRIKEKKYRIYKILFFLDSPIFGYIFFILSGFFSLLNCHPYYSHHHHHHHHQYPAITTTATITPSIQIPPQHLIHLTIALLNNHEGWPYKKPSPPQPLFQSTTATTTITTPMSPQPPIICPSHHPNNNTHPFTNIGGESCCKGCKHECCRSTILKCFLPRVWMVAVVVLVGLWLWWL